MSKKKRRTSKVLSFVVAMVVFMAQVSFASPSVSATNEKVDTVENEAYVSVLSSFYSDEYNTLFRMLRSDVIGITSNGGNYPGTNVDNLIDGDTSTHWETGTQNSDHFQNELVFTFNELTKLNRIVYAPRVSGAAGKGFAQAFKVYASAIDSGNDFKLVATGKYAGSITDKMEIQFEPTDFKRLKFVFTKADQGWAAASEFMFYKEDKISNQMKRLFKSDDLAAVSDEFNTLEKLEALEEEVAEHPLRDQFNASIEDAKSVLAMKEVTPSTAKTKVFNYYDYEDYKKEYMVPLTNIKSIKNNAGHWSSQVINDAVDGNVDTYWETNKGNTENFTNEVEVELKESVIINRLVYGARPSDRKGFAQEFDIYVSPTSKGDTYQLISSGSYPKVSGLVEVNFEPTKAKRVKFVFKKSDQNWATLSELAFFKEDVVQDKVNRLFTDGTMSQVVTEFNTIAKISELENEAQSHLLYDDLKGDIDLAKKIVNGELAIDEATVIKAEQVGNRRSFIQNTLRTDIGSNLQPTGFAALAGQEITVYVEAGGSSNLPSLVFTQHEGSFANWERTVPLNEGKNIITVPTIPTDNYYQKVVTKGGAIYIHNPYTKSQQNGEVSIRIEGAQDFPLMTKDTDPEKFKKELATYATKVAEDAEQNPSVENRKMIDIVELMSDHVIVTGTATTANKSFVLGTSNPLDVVNGYDIWMDKIFAFHGLDGRDATNDPTLIREPIRLMQPWGWMYAAGNHFGIQGTQDSLFYVDLSKSYAGWGINHEVGHRIDLGAREYAEVTNNMTSMAMSVEYNSIDNRIPYEDIYKYVIAENQGTFASRTLQERLGAFWQIEMAYPGYWANLESLYRKNKVSVSTDADKQQQLVKLSSEAVGADLSSHFARHGFTITDETRAVTSQYPKTNKIWYMNNTVIYYEGDGFTEDTAIEVNVVQNVEEKTNTLQLTMNEAGAKDVLGYEILRNGEIVGFTSTTKFVDENINPNIDYTYAVVAYGKSLDALAPVEVVVKSENPEQPGNASEESEESPEQSGNTPEESEESPEQSGNTPEESGKSPEQSGNTPEESEESPEQSGNTPEESDSDVTDFTYFKDVSINHWAYAEVTSLAKQQIVLGYLDKTYQPSNSIRRDHIALVLSRALDLPAVEEAKKFTDVAKTSPYYEAIREVQMAGIFDGDVSGNFNPTDYITRAELAKVLVEAFNLPLETGKEFTDVSKDSFAYKYIQALGVSGLVKGTGNGKFNPHKNITRAEFAVIFYNALS